MVVRENENEEGGVNRWLVRELNQIHAAVNDTNRKVDMTNQKIDSVVVHQIADLALEVATLKADAAVRKQEKLVTYSEFEPMKKLFWAIISLLILGLVSSAAGLVHIGPH